MHRRQLLRTAGGVVLGGSLAGCTALGSDTAGTTQFYDTPGVSANGIDPARLAATVRHHVDAGTYEFSWETDGERRGRAFFRARSDADQQRLLLHSREGGEEYTSYYTANTAYRADRPTGSGVEQYRTPEKTLATLTESFPAALERLTRVWLSGYDYGRPVETTAGIRVDINGGGSQVPYLLTDPQGALVVSQDGLPTELAVSGVPVTTAGDDTRKRLDTGMTLSLSVAVDGVSVTEPAWVDEARQHRQNTG